MLNIRRALYSVAGPILHGRAVYILLRMLLARDSQPDGLHVGTSGRTHIKGHPRDGLILRDRRPLYQLQTQCLVVEFEGEDGAWRGPSPHHQMMSHLEG
jgi:hypothetical protein